MGGDQVRPRHGCDGARHGGRCHRPRGQRKTRSGIDLTPRRSAHGGEERRGHAGKTSCRQRGTRTAGPRERPRLETQGQMELVGAAPDKGSHYRIKGQCRGKGGGIRKCVSSIVTVVSHAFHKAKTPQARACRVHLRSKISGTDAAPLGPLSLTNVGG